MPKLLLVRTINHNTIKFLIGISTTFLSDIYGGRASDKFIFSDIEFFDCFDSYDEVIADREFHITNELMMKYCTLSVPQGSNHR